MNKTMTSSFKILLLIPNINNTELCTCFQYFTNTCSVISQESTRETRAYRRKNNGRSEARGHTEDISQTIRQKKFSSGT